MRNDNIRNIAHVRFACQQRRLHKMCKWFEPYLSKSCAMTNQCRHYSGGDCTCRGAQDEAFYTELEQRRKNNQRKDANNEN